MSKDRKPWGFCETPEEQCTMNYCDENGCQNRKRNLVANEEPPDTGCTNPMGCACKEANGYPLTDCTYWQNTDTIGVK